MSQVCDTAQVGTKTKIDKNVIWNELISALDARANWSIIKFIFEQHLPSVQDFRSVVNSAAAQRDLKNRDSLYIGSTLRLIFEASVDYYGIEHIQQLVHLVKQTFNNLSKLNKV